MRIPKKVLAAAAGVLTACSLAAIAQDPAAPASADQSRQIVVYGTIDWVRRSDISALKEGVIEDIEFKVGRRVKKGEEIGRLFDKMAALTEAKAKQAAENVGEIMKAEAQKKLALATLARLQRLNLKNPGFVSKDEQEKAEAELSVALALLQTAKEAQQLAKRDFDLAVQAREEHKIIAPFDGVITDRMKNPGESVRANESVVRVGDTEKMRFVGWVPLETAFRIKGNEVIEVRAVVENAKLEIEDHKYHGKLTAVAREISTVRAAEVQVFGEIENPANPDHPELELRQGMKAEMTILLDKGSAKVATTKP